MKHATRRKHIVSILLGTLLLLWVSVASADHVVLLPEELDPILKDAVQAAGFDRPQGMAVTDEEILYVADTFNHCVRSIDTNTAIIRTILGTCGKSGKSPDGGEEAPMDAVLLHNPAAIHWNQWGETLYLLDSGNGNLLIFQPGQPEETVRSVRLDGLEEFMQVPDFLSNPLGISVDNDERIYIADSAHHRIVAVGADGQHAEIMAGTGQPGYASKERIALNSPIDTPTDVIVWHGEDGFSGLFTIDSKNGLMHLITPGENEPWLMNNYAGSDNANVWRQQEGAAQLFRLHRPYRLVYSSGKVNTFFISVPTEKRIIGISSEREAFVAAGPGAWEGFQSEVEEEMARIESVRNLGTPHALAAKNYGHLWVFVDSGTLRAFLPTTFPPEEPEE